MAKRDLTVRVDPGAFDRRIRHLYNEASRDRDRYREALELIASRPYKDFTTPKQKARLALDAGEFPSNHPKEN